MLKSQDVMIAALLAVHPEIGWNFEALAERSGLSKSAAFRAVKRLRDARLVVPEDFRVFDERFVNFLTHGVPYMFSVAPGKLARGIPTAYAAAPLNEHIQSSTPLVWPDAKGLVRGESLPPLAPTAPAAAQQDDQLYQLLALIDGLRIGRPREQLLAAKLLKELLNHARVVTQSP